MGLWGLVKRWETRDLRCAGQTISIQLGLGQKYLKLLLICPIMSYSSGTMVAITASTRALSLLGVNVGHGRKSLFKQEPQHTNLTHKGAYEPLGSAVDDTRISIDFRAKVVPV